MAALVPVLLLAAADGKPRVFVLDVKDDGVGPDVVRTIHDTLVSHLASDRRVDVLSSEDVRRSLDVEAQRQALGCDTNSCLTEIASALGAEHVIHGSAGKLGDVIIVNLSLYDARAGEALARRSISVTSLEALPPELARAADELIAPLDEGPGPLALGLLVGGAGGLAVGAGALIGGGLLAGTQVAARDAADTYVDKQGAQDVVNVGAGIAIGGAAVMVLGAGVLVAGALVE